MGRGNPQRRPEKEQNEGGGEALWVAFLLLPIEGRRGWWLLYPTHRAEATLSWGPKSLLSSLPILPSFSSPLCRSDSHTISS